MPVYQEKQLQEISKQFQIYGEILHAETCKIGHINETYSATYDQGGMRIRYIHQKINKYVFKNPTAVMRNLERVSTHLRFKLESMRVPHITRRCLAIIPTRSGKSYYVDRAGDFWRTFVFIEGVHTLETVQSPGQAYQAGYAFGEFQNLLGWTCPRPVPRTIPNFHGTRKRFHAAGSIQKVSTLVSRPISRPGNRVRAQTGEDCGRHFEGAGQRQNSRTHHAQRHQI